ncbi:MAG: HlyD family type I secretion periplasmic adaptor subunit [Pseudomonadota bacterium]
MTWKERRARKARLRKNLKDHLRLDANAELPESHDLRFVRRMIYTLAITLCALLIWSAKTDVSEIVSGAGSIQTTLSVERVEHATGGQVRVIDVAPGDHVSEGRRLLAFETETLTREIAKQRAALVALEAEHARIRYVINGTAPARDVPVAPSQSPEALLFWTEQAYLDAQLELIASGRTSIEAMLASLVSQKAKLGEEVALLTDRLERSRRGLANGTLSKNEVNRQAREALQTERTLLSLEAEIATQQAAIEETRLRTVELMAERRREAALRLADLESSIAATKLSIAELDALTRRSEVFATVSGTIMSLGATYASEVIGAGEVIAEIVPAQSDIRAEVEIPASKIGNVRLGMVARVKVDTFDFTRFGELVGEVIEISPTSLETPEGNLVYSVTVSFSGQDGPPMLDGKPLRPGITVNVDILTESKSVLTYLLKPLRLLRDRAFTEA